MTKIPLERNWTLKILDHNEPSPLENHRAMELGVDAEQKTIYAKAILVHVYGTTAMPCRQAMPAAIPVITQTLERPKSPL